MPDAKPFVLDLDLISGFCTSDKAKSTQCKVSDMAARFTDETAARAMVEGDDPLLCEFYGLDLPKDDPGVLRLGTTILYLERVGEEYLMTKGYFHITLDTSEIHYGLSGHGMVLIGTPGGQVGWKEIGPGEVLYVSGRWVHHSINTGTESLVIFLVYRGGAGHNYGTIKKKGYRKLVVEQNGRPAVVDNPK